MTVYGGIDTKIIGLSIILDKTLGTLEVIVGPFYVYVVFSSDDRTSRED